MASKLAALDEPDAPPKVVRQCSLDKPTQELLKLIFDNDMFNDAMKKMDIGESTHITQESTSYKLVSLQTQRKCLWESLASPRLPRGLR